MNKFERLITTGTMLAAAAGCSGAEQETQSLEFSPNPSEDNYTLGFDCVNHPEVIGGIQRIDEEAGREGSVTIGTRDFEGAHKGTHPEGAPPGVYENATIATGATIQSLGNFAFRVAFSNGNTDENVNLSSESYGFQEILDTEDSHIFVQITVVRTTNRQNEEVADFAFECVDEDGQPLVPFPPEAPPTEV